MAKYNQKTENIEDIHLFYYYLKKFDYFFTKEFDEISPYPIKVQKLKTKLNKHQLLNTESLIGQQTSIIAKMN